MIEKRPFALAALRERHPDIAKEIREKRTATQKWFQLKDGRRLLLAFNGPIHYLNRDSRWQDINLGLSEGPSSWRGHRTPVPIFFPKRSTGKIDIRTGGKKLTLRLLDCVDVGGEKTVETTVRYAGVFPDTDLELEKTALGYRKRIILNGPRHPRKITFKIEGPHGCVLLQRPEGAVLVDEDGESLGVLRSPYVVEQQGEGERGLDWSLDGDLLTVSLPEFKAYPVTIDPDYQGSSDDGYIYGKDTNYATARATSFTFGSSLAYLRLGQALSGGIYYYVYRSYLLFDTSGIPDDGTFDSATLHLQAYANYTGQAFQIYVYRYNWENPITAGNREANYDASGAVYDHSFHNTSDGWVAGTWYSHAVGSLDWINKTGWTKYQLRSSRDVDSLSPSGNEQVLISSYESGNIPYLAITSTTPPTAPSNCVAHYEATDNSYCSWTDNSDNETGFRVEYQVDGGAFTFHENVGANVTQSSSRYFGPDHEVYWRVRAYNDAGNSAWATSSRIFTTPAAPSGCQGHYQATDQSYCTWADNSGIEDNYHIEYRIDGGSWTFFENVAANSTQSSTKTVGANKKIEWRVRAEKGSLGSAYDTSGAVYTTPAAPSGCTAYYQATDESYCAWGDNSAYEDSFRVEYSLDDGAWTFYQNAAANATQSSVKDVGADHKIEWRVRAEKGSLGSAYDTSGAVYTTPAAPGTPSLSWLSQDETIRVTYTKNAAYGDTQIQRKTDGGSYTQVGYDASPYDDTGPSGGDHRYRYKIRARAPQSDDGSYQYSSYIESSGYMYSTPPIPTGLSLSWESQDETARLTYTKNATFGDTDIYRATDNGTSSHVAYDDTSPYDDTAVSGSDHKYDYKIRARTPQQDDGTYEYSSFTAEEIIYSTPAVPTDVQADIAGETQASLTAADASSYEQGFRWERRVDGGAWELVDETGENNPDTTDDNFVKDHLFKYRVRSFRSSPDALSSAWVESNEIRIWEGDYTADVRLMQLGTEGYLVDVRLQRKDQQASFGADMLLYDPLSPEADVILRREPQPFNVDYTVSVSRDGSSWTDISDRCGSLQIHEGQSEKNRAIRSLRISNDEAYDSLNPYDKDSTHNQSGGSWDPLVWPGHRLRITAGLAPVGEELAVYQRVFDGYISYVDMEEQRGQYSYVIVEGIDLSRRLMYTGTTEEQRYGSETETAVATIMKDILDENFGSGTITLYEEGTCPLDVRWVTKEEGDSVWDILQDLALEAGWDLRYRYDHDSDSFRLTLKDPGRGSDKISVLLNLSDDDVWVEQLRVSDAEVRNVVKVLYRDYSSNLPQSVTVQDNESIEDFGERTLRLSEGMTRHIDASSKATTLGNAIVDDLASIHPTHQLEMHFEPDLEPHGMVALHDPKLSSETYRFGVMTVSWTLSAGRAPRCRTVVTGAMDRRVGETERYLRGEVRRFSGGEQRKLEVDGAVTGYRDTVAPQAPT